MGCVGIGVGDGEEDEAFEDGERWEPPDGVDVVWLGDAVDLESFCVVVVDRHF